MQYGLIAEEVAAHYPGLVARNADGQIEMVLYQYLPPMLLNEFQKQQRTIEMQAARIATLERDRAMQTARIEALEQQGSEIAALKQQTAQMAQIQQAVRQSNGVGALGPMEIAAVATRQ